LQGSDPPEKILTQVLRDQWREVVEDLTGEQVSGNRSDFASGE
jgi:hypothetical protein